MTKAEAIAILGPIRVKRFSERQWCPERKEYYHYLLDGKPAGYVAVIRAAKNRLRQQERQDARRNSEPTPD